MKNMTSMMKGNPVVVASIVVALASLAVLFFMVRPAGQTFLTEMEGRKKDEVAIKNLMETPVEVPGETPDAPLRTIKITVTKSAMDALSKVYENMKSQSTTVFAKAAEVNRANHKPMLDNLFPEASGEGQLFAAKNEFRKELRAMLGRRTFADEAAARLNAGPAVSAERLDEELEKVTNKFLAGFFPRKNETELSAADRTRLNNLRSDAAMKMVEEHAKRITIYAVDEEESPDYPFDVGAWAKEGTRPQMRDIWEGQISLWIQQDLVRAIGLANMKKMEPTSLHRSDTVLTAPVKQLVGIHVFEGYVGINTAGAVGKLGEAKAAQSSGQPDIYRTADATRVILDEAKNYNPDRALPEAFNVSLTGRVGNPLYDVRHVKLELVVDARQLPALFEAIGKVNFMTVLDCHVNDIDEFEALQAGYLYGEADCVQVELLIETIWLRELTTPLMPKVIKDELGIVEKPADATATTTGTPGTPAPKTP